METRPKLNIFLSLLHKKIEFISYVLLTLLWILTSVTYYDLPDTIPIHYNASGVPDNFGSKSSIFILTIIGTILFWLLTTLHKLPHIFYRKTVVSGENAEKQYSSALRIIRLLKLAIVIIFILIIMFTYLTATGKTKELGVWFLPFIFCLTLTPTVFYILKALKKNNDGNYVRKK